MAAIVEPLPLELSSEARVWWAWHNGSVVGEDRRHRQVAPGIYLLSLERAVASYHENRRLAEERVEGCNPDRWWNPEWLPLLSPDNGTTIGCDCSVARGRPSPLYVVWWKLPDYDGAQLSTGSMGQMIEWWMDAIESGIWRYDPAATLWTRDYRAVPPEKEGLV
jgi:hypothetical protein